MTDTLVKLGFSTTASIIITETLNVDTLLNVLITFGVSLITIVGGELIKFLVAFFKKKTEQIEGKETSKEDKKDE